MKFIATLIVTALSILLAAELIPGIEITSFWKALIAALLLGVINVTIKPILVILTFPITLLTLGLFYFVLNGFFFAFVAALIDGFEVNSILSAVLGALFVALVSAVGSNMIKGAEGK